MGIIISAMAVFVATLSFGFTIYQGLLVRKHYRMSVRPELTSQIDFNLDDENSFYAIRIRNMGFGPCRIISATVTIGNDQFNMCDKASFHEGVNRYLMERELVGIEFSTMNTNQYGLVGEKSDAVGVYWEKSKINGAMAKRIFESVDEINFVVKYEDLYGEYFVFRGKFGD